jgi:hypothetical protein
MMVTDGTSNYEILAASDLGGDAQYLDLTCTKHRGAIGKETTR